MPSLATRSVPPPRAPRGEKATSRTSLVILMVGAVLVVAWLAFWDESRESSAAFEDFSHEQATLATSVAGGLQARLEAMRRDAEAVVADVDAGRPITPSVVARYEGVTVRRENDPPATSGFFVSLPVVGGRVVDFVLAPIELLHHVRSVEKPGELLLLVQLPKRAELFSTDGRTFRSDAILQALDQGLTSLRLGREDSAAFGLLERTSAAGIARVDAQNLGRFAIVTIATARNVRDREVRARGRLLLGVGLAAGLVGIFGSIALRKQRKELELQSEIAVIELQRRRDERLVRAQRVAMMGTLATGVAHEIGTPLGVIAGRAEQLASRATDDRQRRIASVILEETERIHQVVRGFLDLARGERPTLEKTDPAALVKAAVRLTEHRFQKAGVQLEVDVAPELPLVHCDPRLMEHAVVNLLLNACEATPENGRVAVRAHADHAAVAISVLDDGLGISPEAAAHAFEPFFTTKAAGQGTGLGLAITHEIVRAHHGTLTIEPAKDKGTLARIVLPVAEGEAPSAPIETPTTDREKNEARG